MISSWCWCVHVLSSSLPAQDEGAALYLADMRCLPGMEGGPVLDSAGAFVGMLALPLSNATLQAEAWTHS